MALSAVARERVRDLVAELGDAGSAIDVCRAIEHESGLLRAELAMLACVARDDYELGFSRQGDLTPRGRRLKAMIQVRVHEHEADGDGRVHMRSVVDLNGLSVPVALRFHYACVPDKKRGAAWNIVYFVAVSYSHGPARKLVVLRVKARQSYPCPSGSDDKRVFISGARLERLGRVLRLGLQPPEVLQLLLAFDHFDEEWDVANVVLEAMEAEMDDG